MTITMDDREIKTLKQVRSILESSGGLEFKGLSRKDKYRWIEEVLKRFKYWTLGKKGKGEVKAYLGRMSGFSRAQLTRLVQKQSSEGEIKEKESRRHRFPCVYTTSDRDLLVETDNAHGRLSGPATKRIFERQYDVYGDQRFKRLKDISSAHLYNLRQSRGYQQKTKPTRSRAQSTATSGFGANRRQRDGPDGFGWIRCIRAI